MPIAPKTSITRRSAAERFVCYYICSAGEWQNDLKWFDNEWPHIKSAWAWQSELDSPELVIAFAITLHPFLSRKGLWREAVEWSARALQASLESGEQGCISRIQTDLGLSYANLGQLQLAIQAHEDSLKTSRAKVDAKGEANALCNLGTVYHRQGNLARARALYEQYLALATEARDLNAHAIAFSSLGLVSADEGELSRAIAWYEKALAVNCQFGDSRREAKTLNTLALAYSGLGELFRATELHQQTLQLYRELGDRPGQANALGNLGIAFYRLGQFRKA